MQPGLPSLLKVWWYIVRAGQCGNAGRGAAGNANGWAGDAKWRSNRSFDRDRLLTDFNPGRQAEAILEVYQNVIAEKHV